MYPGSEGTISVLKIHNKKKWTCWSFFFSFSFLTSLVSSPDLHWDWLDLSWVFLALTPFSSSLFDGSAPPGLIRIRKILQIDFYWISLPAQLQSIQPSQIFFHSPARPGIASLAPDIAILILHSAIKLWYSVIALYPGIASLSPQPLWELPFSPHLFVDPTPPPGDVI